MNLILNGDALELDTSDCANLAELVALVERAGSGAEDCVVVSIDVDGERLSPEALSELEKRPLDGIESIAIERRPTRTVAISVLDQGADYTKRIVAAIGQSVEHFRAGRSDLGNGLFADITDSLTVLTGIAYSVESALGEESRGLTEVQGEIFPWLEELIEAQTEEDPIRIADLLEYEIASRVEKWGAIMRSLADGGGVSGSPDAAISN